MHQALRVYDPDLVTTATPPVDPSHQITLRQAYEAYFRRSIKSQKKRTLEAYTNALDHWERLTANPVLPLITDDVLEDFREAWARSATHAAATFNKVRRHLFAILNRCGPRCGRNRRGRGLIREVAYCEELTFEGQPPRIVSHKRLSAIYAACDVATWPRRKRTGCAPADWWRALLVLLFNLGPRTQDAGRLQWEHVSLDQRHLQFVARKTRKLQFMPLNDVLVWHLRKLQGGPSPLVFVGMKTNRQLYETWKKIQREAGIALGKAFAPYDFRDLRHTCATVYDEQFPGVAELILGHALRGVTRRHYINPTGRIKRAVERLKQPEAFTRAMHDIPGQKLLF
jgi:integrase